MVFLSDKNNMLEEVALGKYLALNAATGSGSEIETHTNLVFLNLLICLAISAAVASQCSHDGSK